MARSSTNNGLIRFSARLSSAQLHAVNGILYRLKAEAVDWRVFWVRLLPVLIEGTKEIFASRGNALLHLTYGKAWEPLDKRYLRRRIRKGQGGEPLRRTGKMYSKLTSAQGVLGMSKRELRFGIKAPQAQWLNFSNKGRRPYLGWTKWMEEECSQEMQKILDGIIQERGSL